MNLITLNIWGGHLRDPLLNFIQAHQEVDVFCLQEVYSNAYRNVDGKEMQLSLNIYADLQMSLPNHNSIFRPAVDNVYGLAMLINKNIEIIAEGDINIHQKQHYPGIGENHDRNLQWVQCKYKDQIYSILNVHGLWNGQGKGDTPEGILQSQRIRHFMDTINTPKLLCGDLNLRPDTESLNIIEQGMNNLITVNNIKSTRTQYYGKEEKYADYIITSPEITVNQFSVLDAEVSDHAPLYIEFNRS